MQSKGKIKKTFKHMFGTILATIAIIYVIILIIMYVMQSGLIYFPSRSIYLTPRDIGLEFEEVNLDAGDDVKIHGWFVPHDSARATLLFFHGNGGNISHRLESINQFHQLGLSVFIIDYHGYGQSGGRPGENETYLDAEAAWQYLTNSKNLPPDSIIIFGRSLGGAVASWLAAKYPPKVLILESTFLSIPDIAGHHYPFLPVKLMSRFKYSTKDNMAKIEVPLLVIHSPDDDIIPYKHSERIFELANDPKTFLPINGSHNDGYIVSDAKYREGLDTFLTTHLGE
jgi:fermentation-respiration switch protein FrsA (DUF1100 family)